MKRPIQRDRI